MNRTDEHEQYILHLLGELRKKDEEIERLTAQVETKTKEAKQWKVLRLDADRIREGLMDKEMRLISDIMRLEAELAKYRDAEKDGRLVMWPCSVDKTCYATVQLNCGALDCPKQDENGDCNYDCPNVITEVDPEKVVFANLVRLPLYATHEEAEATLKGSEQHDA